MGITKTAFVDGSSEPAAGKNKEKKMKAHQGEEEKVHLEGLKGGQRIKMVGVEAPVEEKAETGTQKDAGTKVAKRPERVRSKKYLEAKKKFDSAKLFPVADAIKMVKETSYSKFDGTVELHLIVKKTGTSVQVALPNSAGRVKKIEIASDATIEKLKAGNIDFDVLIATPAMMPKLVPFARVLGPKGLMPNPKNGTLVPDTKKAEGFSAATITLKTEKEAPLIHTVIGKVSQADKELIENFQAIGKALGGSKQIEKAFLKATMGPAVKVKI
jgi:large subunit ribosomal protein L1